MSHPIYLLAERWRHLAVTRGLAMAILAISLGGLASAQPSAARPPMPAPPKIEDLELYYAFFNYHQGLINTRLAAKAANPGNSAALDQQMAALPQVDVNELPVIIANTQRVTQAYSKLAADRQAGVYVWPKGVAPPTAAQLASFFEFRRAGITIDGHLGLFTQISSASWTGIHGYIVGVFKDTIYKH